MFMGLSVGLGHISAAPSFTRRRTTAAPMPREPPVTKATLLASEFEELFIINNLSVLDHLVNNETQKNQASCFLVSFQTSHGHAGDAAQGLRRCARTRRDLDADECRHYELRGGLRIHAFADLPGCFGFSNSALETRQQRSARHVGYHRYSRV